VEKMALNAKVTSSSLGDKMLAVSSGEFSSHKWQKDMTPAEMHCRCKPESLCNLGVNRKSSFFSFPEGKIRLWSFTTTDHIQGVVKFEIGMF